MQYFPILHYDHSLVIDLAFREYPKGKTHQGTFCRCWRSSTSPRSWSQPEFMSLTSHRQGFLSWRSTSSIQGPVVSLRSSPIWFFQTCSCRKKHLELSVRTVLVLASLVMTDLPLSDHLKSMEGFFNHVNPISKDKFDQFGTKLMEWFDDCLQQVILELTNPSLPLNEQQPVEVIQDALPSNPQIPQEPSGRHSLSIQLPTKHPTRSQPAPIVRWWGRRFWLSTSYQT